MQTPNTIRITILALCATLAGCVTMPENTVADRGLASDAVAHELRDTRPAFTALAPDEQAVVYSWLLANCAVSADDRHATFVNLGARIEAALIEAFRMGPPTALLAELGDARHSDFTAIKARLEGEDRELFGAELRARLAAVSEDTYVDEGIERTIAGYRTAALDGIASIGSQTSVAWLERTVPTLKDPELHRAAVRTLGVLRDRTRR